MSEMEHISLIMARSVAEIIRRQAESVAKRSGKDGLEERQVTCEDNKKAS